MSEDSERRRQRLNDDLARVVKHIGRIGPRINEVARLSSIHKESVRYRYHKFFLRKGISIQATPSLARLGFTRLVVLAKLRPDLEDLAVSIFTTMSEACYLRSFTRKLLTHEYVIHLAVPKQLKQECEAVFKRLVDVGFFTEMRMFEFDDYRNPPMMAEFYNFINESWSFRWPDPNMAESKFPQARQEQAEKYDRLDLLILKELEIDASRNLVQIAEKVGAPFKSLQSHYLNHVEKRGLVRDYRVIWPGSRYDFERRKAIARKDRYVEINVLLERGTASENAMLRTLLNRTPFLWFEAVGTSYFAEMYIPTEDYVKCLEYLDAFARKMGDKLTVSVMDQDRALRYTIPYMLFDPLTKGWRLDRDAVFGAIGSSVGGPKKLEPADGVLIHR